jgi:hypothetical protein
LSTDAATPASPADDGPAPEARPAAGPVAGPTAVPVDSSGGRLTARLREARARLEPERPSIPAPRSPEGVVPPPVFGRGAGAPSADLVKAVEKLLTELADLEDDTRAPERRTLVRAVELAAAGIPDEGWSAELRVDDEALTGASELAASHLTAAEALLERLDREDRGGPAVEVDGVVTSLRVAKMVLDLESFTRRR